MTTTGGTCTTSYTVTDLTNGIEYSFVRAVNAIGVGAASNANTATPGGRSVPAHRQA